MPKVINLFFSALFLMYTLAAAQNGIVRTYFAEGGVFSELSIVNDIWEGTSYWFFENGNLKLEKTFDNGRLNGWVREFYESGLVSKEYYVLEGVLDGIYKEYYENGALREVRNYNGGVLLKRTQLSFDSTYKAPLEAYQEGNRQYNLRKKDDTILCDVDICPAPIGGLSQVFSKLHYNEKAKLYGLEGNVILSAKITAEGKVRNIKVISGLGLGLDEEAQRVFASANFLPGQKDGKPVSSQITMKFPFVLDDSIKAAQLTKREKFEQEKEIIREKPVVEDTAIVAPAPDIPAEPEISEEIFETNNFACNVEECPEPKGGLKEILSHLDIPLQARNLRLTGDVIILADIDEFGFVRDTQVLKGIGYGCDESAENALYRTRFKPGKNGGEFVAAKVRIIVPFRLNKSN